MTAHVISRLLMLIACLVVTCNSIASQPADTATCTGTEVADAWLKGKAEMAILLNRYLKGFNVSVGVGVVDGNVILTGGVSSDIDHDLAEQIVLGIDGVGEVDNQLRIDAKPVASNTNVHDNRLIRKIEDATLTARVKSKLVLNGNIQARRIDVDTRDQVVTLSGTVTTAKQRDLAVQLARNTDEVKDVQDRLQVEPAS